MYKIVKKELLTNSIYLMDILAPRVAKSALPGHLSLSEIQKKVKEYL